MNSYCHKCHLLLNNSCKKKIKIGDFEIESSTQEKILEITIDNNVSFHDMWKIYVKILAERCML